MNDLPLARYMVDRAAHRRGDPEWLAQAWQRALVLVVDARGRTLVEGDRPDLVFIIPEEVPAGQRLFLGEDPEGTPYFAVIAELPAIPGTRSVTLRDVGALLSDRDAGLFVTAAALANWHVLDPYSPTTGQATHVEQAGWLRVDADGEMVFPRTDPAVIVLVHDAVPGPDGRCLLGNHAGRGQRGGYQFFSTLAGFVEPGESAEAAVVREIHEEVGVTVTDLRYEGSQAWPFPRSLMLGFTAVADPAAPLRVDEVEIAEARWFTRRQVRELLSNHPGSVGAPHGVTASGAPVALPGPASIAHYLIKIWLDRA